MITKRPALAAAVVMGIGIIIARYAVVPWEIFLLLAAIFFLFALWDQFCMRTNGGRERVFSAAGILFLLSASASSIAVRDAMEEKKNLSGYCGTDSLWITCRVIDEPRRQEGKTKLLVGDIRLRGEFDSTAVEGRAYVTIVPNKRIKEKPTVIPYGSILTFKGIWQEPGTARNPGEFSYRDYLALNNIYAVTTVYGYGTIAVAGERKPNWFFESIIFPSKDFIIRTITTVMKGDEANFLIGLLLGDRTDLSDEIKKAFTHTGTIHVLAVSGSHVILVVGIIYVIVGLLRLSTKPKIIITLFILIYYTFLTGASPSIVRASIMTGIVLVGKLFEQKTDLYNVLGLSAVIMFLYDPRQLFDVGFQLSFSAVFSMVYFYPQLNALVRNIPEPLEEFKIITPVWQLFAVSLAAQIGTIPFTAYYFGQVSLVSLFANLVVVPLVGIIVTIGLSGAVVGIVSMGFASAFSEVNALLAWFTLTFVKLAEQVPYAVVDTAAFGWKEGFFYSAIIGILFNIRNSGIVKKIVIASLCVINLLLITSLGHEGEPKLKVTFLDVGQGDCAVIQFPAGETYLIDGGPVSAGFDAGEKIVAPFLRRNGIGTIDAIITTHPHADHLGGVPYLMRNFTVKRTIDPGQHLNTALYRDYALLEKEKEQITARAGLVAEIGNARLYFLHPVNKFIDTDSLDGYSDINDVSVVCKVQYGSTSFVFMGDAELESEHHIVSLYNDFLDTDVLKAGHHGSSTSSSNELIAAATPEYAVISVARFNKFKHPSRFILERFRRAGATVHRTDVEGAIIFESDGKRVIHQQWRPN